MKWFNVIFILFILISCGNDRSYVLEKYTKLPDEVKKLSLLDDKALKEKKKELEGNINFIRDALGDKKLYKIEEIIDKEKVIKFDISKKDHLYVLQLLDEELLQMVKKHNPAFKQYEKLIKKYNNAVHINFFLIYKRNIKNMMKNIGFKLSVVAKANLHKGVHLFKIIIQLKKRFEKAKIDVNISINENNHLVLDFKRVRNPQLTKFMITTVGHLTLQLVNEKYLAQVFKQKDKIDVQLSPNENFVEYIKDKNKITHKFKLTDDAILLEYAPSLTRKKLGFLPVYKKVEIDNQLIEAAYISSSRTTITSAMNNSVNFKLTPQGKQIFFLLTKKNIQNRLAIILDQKIITAPVIQSEIAGGRAQITGNFTQDEAKLFAFILNSGKLDVPLEIIKEKATLDLKKDD